MKGRGRSLMFTVHEMQDIAEPDIDVPLLIDTLERCLTASEGSQITESNEKSLFKLYSLNLPAGASPKTWRKAWARKMNNKRLQNDSL